MPKRTMKSRPSRKRTTFRAKRRKAKISKAVVPNSHIVKLRYVQYVNLDGPIGTAQNHVFRANSIQDPDFTGVGHQPMGHDEWGTFYDHYNVISSKCSAQFISTGATAATDAAMVGILLKDNSTTILDPIQIMEQTNSSYGVVTTANANQTKRINKSYSAKGFFAIKDVQDNRGLLGAAFGSNPVEDAYFHVYQAPLSATDDARPMRVIVTIEYICHLTERKSLSQS